VRICLEKSPNGREVLECYGKCADKCSNTDAYRWCVQACQGLNECDAYEGCADKLEGGTEPGCLTKEPSDCVAVTTTSTSTSSSTSTTTKATTTTSSSTSSTSPL